MPSTTCWLWPRGVFTPGHTPTRSRLVQRGCVHLCSRVPTNVVRSPLVAHQRCVFTSGRVSSNAVCSPLVAHQRGRASSKVVAAGDCLLGLLFTFARAFRPTWCVHLWSRTNVVCSPLVASRPTRCVHLWSHTNVVGPRPRWSQRAIVFFSGRKGRQ